ncbi:AraC family transcriptional regulator [Paraburkholderia sp. GAS348]|uniref:AraC family transcriptional regulator n=1 Tax=Paraburkholderia sp. GAS348 TaxID=3035132 RepID=UPI003D1FE3FE
MSLGANPTQVHSPLKPGIAHSHFDVQTEPPQGRLLAWRDRVGHVIDVLPSLSELDKPFQASIDRYQVGQLVFTDCRSDTMVLERSQARISTDKVRDVAFHVFLEGGVENITLRATPRKSAPAAATMLALDLNQPIRMQRNACRVLTLFVPGEMVQAEFPDAEAIHGRTIHGTTPLTRLIVNHLTALSQNITQMSPDAADEAIRSGAQMLIALFGKQALLSGNARAAGRAAMFGQARRYIQANRRNAALSPESVVNALRLPRLTLYRLFQHEGGVGTYIRHLRLRHAADDLAREPHTAVASIAYELGFKSPTDFTRAFRRAYGMTPLDFRRLTAQDGRGAVKPFHRT